MTLLVVSAVATVLVVIVYNVLIARPPRPAPYRDDDWYEERWYE
jgi:hypothetical protein